MGKGCECLHTDTVAIQMHVYRNRDLYVILGLQKDANQEDIKKAYRKVMLRVGNVA